MCANDQSVQSQQTYSAPTYDSVTANAIQAYTRQEKSAENKKPPLCHSFAKGNCTRDPCRFTHALPPEHRQTQTQTQKQSLQAQKNAHPKNKCHRCGSEEHSAKECKYNGKCGHCGRMGHMESVCNAKKAGKPRVLFSAVDGGQTYANMIKVSISPEGMSKMTYPSEGMSKMTYPSPDALPSPPMALEKFFADTGANQSLHPNRRSATTYSRVSLNISTAATGKSMRSQGVGAMELFTPEGERCPGFDNVIFSTQCAEKLASVCIFKWANYIQGKELGDVV